MKINLVSLFAILFLNISCQKDSSQKKLTKDDLISAKWVNDTMIKMSDSVWSNFYTSGNPVYQFNSDGTLIIFNPAGQSAIVGIFPGSGYLGSWRYPGSTEPVQSSPAIQVEANWHYDESRQELEIHYSLEPHTMIVFPQAPSPLWIPNDSSYAVHYRLKEFSDQSLTFSQISNDNSEYPALKFILKKQ